MRRSLSGDAAAQARARAWVQRFVVELDLCPFAADSIARGGLEIEVSDARAPNAVAQDLIECLAWLQEPTAAATESLLLVVPEALRDFSEFNAFLDVADRVVEDMGLEGVFQIASFHPDYRFADAPEDDPAHATNRSPDPMLHILREAAVARAVAAHPDPADIPVRNAALLRALGRTRITERLAEITKPADEE